MELQMKLLLGSGGFSTKERQFKWQTVLRDFLKDQKSFLFIPYALHDYNEYCKKLREWKSDSEIPFKGIHEFSDPIQAIQNAEAIYIGGGNSFRLMDTILKNQLIEPIQKAVKSGTPYVGVSAGTNLASPTIKTTNDMPIVHPQSLDALNLIPFQINPHYFSGRTHIKKKSLNNENEYIAYGGETRDDRIREFHEMNDTPVLGLWEGEILKVENKELSLHGLGGARLFQKGKDPLDIPEGGHIPKRCLFIF